MKKIILNLLFIVILLPATGAGKRNPLFPRDVGRGCRFGEKGKEKDFC